MFFKRIFCLLFSLALLLSACQPINLGNLALPAPTAASEAPQPAPAAGDEAALPDLGTLQIAFVPLIDAAPFFVAADKGYFAEQGLQVELQSVRSVDEMLAPLSTGKIDMTQMGITTGFLNARQQQLDFRMVAGVADPTVVPSESTPFLVVSKALADSGEITEVADLKGHKIAINLRGSVPEFFLSKGLEQAGLTLDDVEMVTVPRTEMLVAIKNGAVDGAVAGILNIQAMIGEGVAVPLLADTDVPTGGVRGGVVFGQRMLDPANREVAIRLMVAYLQAARYLNDGGWDDPAVIASVATYTGMDAALVERSSKIVFAANGEINDAGLLDMQAFQISRGYVEYTEALPVTEMVDLTILSEALARLAQK